MRLRTRTLLKIATSLIIVGAIICFGSFLAGAGTSIRWNNLNIGLNGLEYAWDSDFDSKEFNTIHKTLDTFDKVTLEVDTMDIRIKTGEAYQLEASYLKKDQFTYEMQGKELIIKQKNKINVGINLGNKVGQLTLYVPEGKSLSGIDMTIGVGETRIEDITTEDFKLYGGVGEVTAKNIASQNTEITVGVGEVNLQGDLKGALMIKGGVGEFTLETIGSEKDYNYNLTRGIGDIKINDHTNEGFGNANQNNGAKNQITIIGGLGDITIKTNK